MSNGKEKCELLTSIRRQVAKAYGLRYNPMECTHEGDCAGTCPKCDAEIRYLQRQLKAIGVTDIDLGTSDIDVRDIDTTAVTSDDIHGFVAGPDDMIMGLPAFPPRRRRKRLMLYREFKINGVSLCQLDDEWRKLAAGDALQLMHHEDTKYAQHVVTVTTTEECDGGYPNIGRVLGYVPKEESKTLAAIIDSEWDDILISELSRIEGDDPHNGNLWMRIYIAAEQECAANFTQLRLLEIDNDTLAAVQKDLDTRGCTHFRWGGFPPWEHNLPDSGDTVVLMHREGEKTTLYMMLCIAVGDQEAAEILHKDMECYTDDCCYYLLAALAGPLKVDNSNLEFIDKEDIDTHQPERYLSYNASRELLQLFGAHR